MKRSIVNKMRLRTCAVHVAGMTPAARYVWLMCVLLLSRFVAAYEAAT